MSAQEVAVYRYTPQPNYPGGDARHCREGMAILFDDGRMVDTFWGTMSDAHVLRESERSGAEHLFALADFRELDQYAHASRATWETFHPDDRRVITSQHGLLRRYFVRIGAVSDLPTQIENAREALAAAEAQLRSAQSTVDRRLMELDALQGATS